jgi:hypothetical protein
VRGERRHSNRQRASKIEAAVLTTELLPNSSFNKSDTHWLFWTACECYSGSFSIFKLIIFARKTKLTRLINGFNHPPYIFSCNVCSFMEPSSNSTCTVLLVYVLYYYATVGKSYWLSMSYVHLSLYTFCLLTFLLHIELQMLSKKIHFLEET